MPASILIADDYDDNRELLRLMLESAGHRVRETRDGREFVEAARAEAFDVALVDLSMPVLDGWRALAELRGNERTRALPCVAVTAFAAEPDRRRALDAGFDAYVSKPFRSKDILEVIEALAGHHGGSRDGCRPTAAQDGDGRLHPVLMPRPSRALVDEDSDG